MLTRKLKKRRLNRCVKVVFDGAYYRFENPDIVDAGVVPLQHFLLYGWKEGRNPNALFATAWYLEQNPDVAEAGVNPLVHYLESGWKENRNPSPEFNTHWYQTQNPDVVAAGYIPLIHYLTLGRSEGRTPLPSAVESVGELTYYAASHAMHLIDSERSDFSTFDADRLTQQAPMKSEPSKLSRPFVDQTAGLAPREIVSLIQSTARLRHEEPAVSVIVPAYKNLEITLRCVLSLLESKDITPFQILIVDDCSPDASGEFLKSELSEVSRIDVVINESNLGFLKSCNAAAKLENSEFLFFLNNDTVVMDGWLDELVRVFETETNVGLAGSKLIYPDGQLQEAGGIIWNDASGANYGRLGDPWAPQFNYARDVDYVSGASIILPRSIWEEVGSFSEEFAPAYYEDTDLAMKVRAIGKRVVYQPHSMVIHYEGASSGRDITKGIKRHQAVNQEKFLAKWRGPLSDFGPHADFSLHVVDRRAKGRILIFDAETPMPDKDSGSITAFHYMRILRQLGYHVTFVPENMLWSGRYSRDLQRLGVEVIFNPYEQDARQYVLDNGHNFDLFILSRATAGGMFFDELKSAFPDKPLIFDTVDIHHLRLMRQYELDQNQETFDEAQRLKEIELNAIRKADTTIIVSDVEVSYIQNEIGPFENTVIPLIYEPFDRTSGFDERTDIAFIGGFRHTPNVDAVNYLVREIWPIFNKLGTGAKLHLIGSHMPADFLDFACDDIVVVGFVKDLERYLQGIRLTVAPLRYGAGVKGKVGNSLRMGVPVIGTPVATEGMGLEPGKHVLVEQEARAFANAMRRLYTEAEYWESLSRDGQQFVLDKFGIEAASAKLQNLCDALIDT